VSEHVTDRLPLEAAGALDPDEAARVAAHLRECAACATRAAEWRALVEGLREMPPARPSPALLARTQRTIEWQLAERTERAWNRAALGFVIAFAWTLSGVAWLVLDLLGGELALRLGRPLGSTATWYAAYLVAGWVTAGAAAVLLGRRTQEEGRIV
jgi:anti-sigma factor RsiW